MNHKNSIAIIGMSCRYPGANSIHEYWNLIKEGKDAITPIPENRKHLFYTKTDQKEFPQYGGFIDNVDKFDSSFFNISPREANKLDPQQRIALELTWEAFENAGINVRNLQGSKTGIFAGIFTEDYQIIQGKSLPYNDPDIYFVTGTSASTLSGRLSHFYDFMGPSVTLNTACSSSLIAVHLACQSLKNNECDLALAAGVNIILSNDYPIALYHAGMLSSDGRSKAFDAGADGYGRSEGCGVVVLMPYEKAVKENYHIWALISGSAINHNGATNQFLAPNAASQEILIKDALANANASPLDISYVEAHGTGTILGDTAEIKAIESVYGKDRSKKMPLYLGSVKTNIGHTEAASGIAGLIKTAFSLKYATIPAHLYSQNISLKIKSLIDCTPAIIPKNTIQWKSKQSRMAGVNSFGFSGINAHMILSEYIDNKESLPDTQETHLIVLSAKTKKQLKEYAKQHIDFASNIQNQSFSNNLRSIAYTLQNGRVHMGERLAIKVKTIDEMLNALKAFISDHENINNVYYGNINHQKSKEILNNYPNQKGDKLDHFARLWINGHKINWNELNDGIPEPQPVMLPTYPFERNSYWLDNKTPEQSSLFSQLHPFVHQNVSTINVQQFSSHFTGNEFFFNDHVVLKQKTFPAVAYLEMARAAGMISCEKPIHTISDVVWISPVQINDDQTDVCIRLYPEKNDLQFDIFNENSEEIFAQGKIILEQSDHSINKILDIAGIQNRCTVQKSKKECYTDFKKSGFTYGDTFQSISKVHIGEKEVISQLNLPTALFTEFDDFVLHPSLMDGALQTIFEMQGIFEPDMTYLPFSMERLSFFKSLTKNAYAYVKLSQSNTSYTFDVALIDSAGQICVQMKALTLRPVSKKQTPELLFFNCVWENKSLEKTNKNLEGITLVCDYPSSIVSDLYNKDNSDIFQVFPGDMFKQISDKQYQIRVDHFEDYLDLLNSLHDKKKFPDNIVHLWSKEINDSSTIDMDELHKYSLHSVFYLCKALLSYQLMKPICMIYVYLSQHPIYQAISGFAKTLHKENSLLFLKMLTKDYQSDLTNCILSELSIQDSINVRYINNNRQINYIREYFQKQTSLLELKEKGVYLITGGLGGLGFIFAKYLISKVSARLILCGRKKYSEINDHVLRNIPHSDITYIQADITKRSDTYNLVAKVKEKYGLIDGIIHCAGIISDAMIVNKNVDSLNKVLLPKVNGTIYLDDATKNEPIDFFILFSSVSAAFGNAGQCDYAYANAFMDYFAQERNQLVVENKRYGKTLSINWPLWKSKGMSVDSRSETLMEKISGQLPLEKEFGFSAFKTALSSHIGQIIVTYGSNTKIRQFVEQQNHLKPIPKKTDISIDDNKLIQAVQDEIRRIVSQILFIDMNDIVTDANLTVMGFDSMTFTELANQINQIYQINITPTLFFEHNSIESLVQALYETHGDVFKSQLKHLTTVNQEETSVHVLEPKWTLTPARKRFLKKTSPQSSVENNDIAIIGISGSMPGSIDLNHFWEHLISASDLITETPLERWDFRKYYHEPDIYLRYGGFIPGVDKFDADFFNISSKEAELMDPQHRLFLTCVWQTIEDAGYKATDLSNSKTGVFAGVSTSDYALLLKEHLNESWGVTGNFFSMLVNRISYYFNFHGPSEPVDTACSSSLIAIHRAVESIKNHQCDMAIAGGVNVMLSPTLNISFSKAGMLSKSGRCKTFDKDADGYVRGEGVGAVLLKPLIKAKKDKDHIYAVIKGTAENHGGRSNSLTAPNPKAQEDLLTEIYEKANIDPSTISYIETHGTGTALGDPIEINALKKAFSNLFQLTGKQSPEKPYCGLGTLKTNIGHLEAAAGIAGFLKVILSLKHKQLPPILHLRQINPHIQLDQSPFYIIDSPQKWDAFVDNTGQTLPRRAGISSFGFGGANAHVILEEYPASVQDNSSETSNQLIVLSAKNRNSLSQYSLRLAEFCQKNHDKLSLLNIAYTLQTGREAMNERLAMIVSNIDDLQNKLQSFQKSTIPADCYTNNIKSNILKPELLFDEEDGKNFLDTLIQKKNLHKIGMLWVSGVEIDWNILYVNRKPERISLPTYPFEQKRYWVTDPKTQNLVSTKSVGTRNKTESNQNDISHQPANQNNDMIYYVNEWVQSTIDIKATFPDSHNLIFDQNKDSQGKWGKNSIQVIYGKSFEKSSQRISIRPDCYEDYEKLFSTLKSINKMPEIIIHQWSQDTFDMEDQECLNKLLSESLFSVFCISKVLLKNYATHKIQFFYVYKSHQNFPNPIFESISAFLSAVKAENKNLLFKTIEIDKYSDLYDIISKEYHRGEHVDIQYINGSRKVKEYREIQMPDIEPFCIKEKGIYLICGGTGQLGLVMAQFFARQSSVSIILCGRREKLDDATIKKIHHIKQSGSEVLYMKADITKKNDVLSLVKNIHKKLGHINGIIHCSGLAQNTYLMNKEITDIKRVIDAKVSGTINLDQATRTEPLDFFVLFSSISSFMANMGLSDYAYANRFLDNFSQVREGLVSQKKRFGRTISINWPFWVDGGMRLNTSVDQEQAISEFIFKSTGTTSIASDQATKIFSKVLSLGYTPISVLPGNASKIRQYIHTLFHHRKQHRSNMQLSDDSIQKMLKKLHIQLLNFVSQVLSINENEINIHDDIHDFGFDSIAFTNLANLINDTFNIGITPAVFYAHKNLKSLADALFEDYQEKFIPRSHALRGNASGTLCVPCDIFSDSQHRGRRASSMHSYAERGNEENNQLIQDKHLSNMPVAIIGMSAILPQSEDIQTFWQHIIEGNDLITNIPSERLCYLKTTHSEKEEQNPINWGGFIPDIDKFDAQFFGILSAEAKQLAPQQRLLLQTVWKALEDAGYRASDLSNSKTGVFVGGQEIEYQTTDQKSLKNNSLKTIINAQNFLANRISFMLNLNGPSQCIHTACSSGLVAIHRAIDAIRCGHCNTSIVGAVHLLISPNETIALNQIDVLSADGRCKTFDKKADGYVRSEGIAAMLLKPLDMAEKDNDHIYAVIKGSAENHGGKASSLTAPNPDAQSELLVSAYENAGVDPSTVTYIETHGTGTALGDPVEINALKQAFSKLYHQHNKIMPQTPHIGLGSVKTNIGHLEPSSGLAGMIKVVLSMKHRMIPGNIHFNELNPYIELENSPFYILKKNQKWEPLVDKESNKAIPRRAGVSSFGFGGSNAHVILEEYSNGSQMEDLVDAYIIVLSAKTKKRLNSYVSLLVDYLKDHKNDISLLNIAFTLQTGREEMDERLAIHVSTIDALVNKCSIFLNEKKDSDIFTGNAKHNQNISDLFMDEDMGKELIGKLIRKKQMDKLSQLWVVGAQINWNDLYTGKIKPRRISLPTYPFEKKAYWISDSTYQAGTKKFRQYIHPLLHENTSTLDNQEFTTTLSPDDFFLKDHVIQKQTILPAVAMIEMANAAAEISCKRKIQHISQITWLSPVVIDQDEKELSIALFPEKSDVLFEIYFKDTDNLCTKGKIIISGQTNLPDEKLNITDIQHRCSSIKSKADCYQLFSQSGIYYGETFQSISKLFIGDKEVLGFLEMSSSLEAHYHEFMLHPSLLDGAFQIIIGLVNQLDPGETYIPFSLGDITFIQSIPRLCYAYACFSQKNHAIKSFDISIADETGKICVLINGLALRSVSMNEKTGLLYLKTNWEDKPIEKTTKNIDARLLVFDREPSKIQEFYNNIESKTIQVFPGDSYQQLNSKQYQIRLDHNEDYQSLFIALRQSNQFPETIIHLWSDHQCHANNISMDECFKQSIYSLFGLCKALLCQELENPIRIVYVYEGSNPIYEAISGFAKTLHKENSLLFLKTLTTDHLSNFSQCILSECFTQDFFDIRYRENNRQALMIKEYRPEITSQLSIHKNGVYVITGGFGRIGLSLAHYLSTFDLKKIILCGRKALPDKEVFEKLNAIHSDIIYYQLDVTRKESVKPFLSKVNDLYGQVNGIIHCAGIINDSTIRLKAFSDFKKVILPKVSGLLNLDHATRNVSLDFFVFFSSISGCFGNEGQSDYAYGNAFMDFFSQWRNELVAQKQRSGRTISINWPLWENMGMSVHGSRKKHIETISGMLPLPKSDGIKAFETALSQKNDQLIVTYGKISKIKQYVEKNNSFKQLKKVEKVPADDQKNIHSLQLEICRMVINILQVDMEVINIDDALTDYGFDSVTFTELSNQINTIYDFETTPALFFEFNSIRSIATALYEKYHDSFQQQLPEKSNDINEVTSLDNKTYHETRATRTRFVSHSRQNNQKSESTIEDIAIIGISGMMPGSKDLNSFWQHLLKGNDLITEVPSDRWDIQKYNNDIFLRYGGFMPDVDKFDADFFNISPREADLMDPQQRLLLTCVWQSIEDAGYKISDVSNSKTSIFVGVSSADYLTLLNKQHYESPWTSTGNANSMLANRISYYFNLKGASEVIDTACSSSLIAIHRAVKSIQKDSCELAIAGGVNVILKPEITISFAKAGLLSKDGRCKAFDKNANGYVRGEGVGAILMKPLSKAKEDRDHIYAVIKGSAINHGGRTNTLTSPNPNALSELIVAAYRNANIDPSTVEYIETHGTGTYLGDTIEFESLTKAFSMLYKYFNINAPEKSYCGLGAVKNTIGHLEAASGMASVFKVILSLKHKQLLKNNNINTINPTLNIANSPFYMLDKNKKWEISKTKEGEKHPRRAGVTSFGFGGSNAHVILEEYPSINDHEKDTDSQQIVILSAKKKERLKEYARTLVQYIANHQNTLSLLNIVYTLQVGREAMNERLAIPVSSKEELIKKLTAYVIGEKDLSIYTGNSKTDQTSADILMGDEAGKEYILKLVHNKQIDKICHLWVMGVNINWHLLYSSRNYSKRVSLPSYPFEKNRYWIDESEQRKDSNAGISKLPCESSENKVIEIISNLTGIENTNINKNDALETYRFSSILTMTFLQLLNEHFHTEITINMLLDCNTIQDILNVISSFESIKQSVVVQDNTINVTKNSDIVLLNHSSDLQPVFWFNTGLGGGEPYKIIADNCMRPFYGLKPIQFVRNNNKKHGTKGVASYYVSILETMQPKGSFDIGGYSIGGRIAYEVACKLQEKGRVVKSIVMLDSMYCEELKTIDRPIKESMLSFVNWQLHSLLSTTTEIQTEHFIHHTQVDANTSEDQFLEQLISIAREKGLTLSKDLIRSIVVDQKNVILAYDIKNYTPDALKRPEEIQCYYFRNKNRLFFGKLQPYFRLNNTSPLDNTNYWSEWQKQLPNMIIFDLDASSHLEMLNENNCVDTINDFCEALYSKRGFSKDFIQKFSEKTLVEHGTLDLAVQILFPH
jgi:polyketide synthase PksN